MYAGNERHHIIRYEPFYNDTVRKRVYYFIKFSTILPHVNLDIVGLICNIFYFTSFLYIYNIYKSHLTSSFLETKEEKKKPLLSCKWILQIGSTPEKLATLIQWMRSPSKVFSYCMFPFLLTPAVKSELLRDCNIAMMANQMAAQAVFSGELHFVKPSHS